MSAHTTVTTGARTNGTQAVRPRTTTSLRLPALAGAVFFALIIVYAELRSPAPAASDSAREVASYFARHHERLQLGAVALGFAMPAVLIWLTGLVQALRQVEGPSRIASLTALGGGILAAASTVTGALVQGTTAIRFVDLGAGGTRTGWTMVLLSLGGTLLGLMLVIGATAAVSLRTQLFARWFTVASCVLVLLSLIGAFTIGYGSDAIQIIAGIAVLLDSVWILLVSVFMWRNPQRAAP
ncbi:MAG: hypothetical protein ACXVRN_13565 [Solirubrobacteraceae bacterium]